MMDKSNATGCSATSRNKGVTLAVPAVPPVLRDVGKLAAGVAAVATGSATGNPRNKVALQPGHSLMDWIRLGQSGCDLTGVGERAGTLSISPKQLAEHCTEEDAWISIRGKVYNVTNYLSFHPGGGEELMRGAGKDATQLFNSVHAWVNYESILNKCLIGRLTSVEPDVDTEELFYGTSSIKKIEKVCNCNVTSSNESTINSYSTAKPCNNELVTNHYCSAKSCNNKSSTNSYSIAETCSCESTSYYSTTKSCSNESTTNNYSTAITSNICPRFDWIQKSDCITIYFYTKAFRNPQVQITAPSKENDVDVIIIYDNNMFTNQFRFSNNIHWPCKLAINYETGRVSVEFRKIIPKIWDTYGTLKQNTKVYFSEKDNMRFKYIVMSKVKVNYNSCLLSLQRSDGARQTVPIGYYVQTFAVWNGQEIDRYYTALPCDFLDEYNNEHDTYRGDICLLIKGYATGMMSPQMCSKKKGDIVEISSPKGSFDLSLISNKEGFLMLAAGTGIAPMLGVIKFLLERKQLKCKKITVLFFNRTEEDILCSEPLQNLQERDNRFKVVFILSGGSPKWKGKRGHVNPCIIRNSIYEQFETANLQPFDLFLFACGPLVFTNYTQFLFRELGFPTDQQFCFSG